MIVSVAELASGWEAELALEYEFREGRTVLAHRRHRGPLRVQRDLYPEGARTCHTIVVHPPGGIAGGDRLAVSVSLGEASAALLTTPGAAKWYRSTGAEARQTLLFKVAGSASLEWLPQESIIFSGARAAMSGRVELSGAATYFGWDVVCLGRRASGERFSAGSLSQRFEVTLDGRRLWNEFSRIEGNDPLLHSPVGLRGASVYGTLLAAGREIDRTCSRELLAECRQFGIADESTAGSTSSSTSGSTTGSTSGSTTGITRLPGMLVARYLGDDSEEAKCYFAGLWRLLRPAHSGRTAQPPRIWAT